MKFIIIESLSENIVKVIQEHFQDIKILEHSNGYDKMKIQKSDYSIGYLFGFIENLVFFHFVYFL